MSSFNLLKNGVQFKYKSTSNIKDNSVKSKLYENEDNKTNTITSDVNKDTVFPDCWNEKKKILLIKKKIEKLTSSNESNEDDELKDKKIEELKRDLSNAKNELNEKLNLSSQNIDDIEPLCSFKEIQK
jgi:hypothetical protein